MSPRMLEAIAAIIGGAATILLTLREMRRDDGEKLETRQQLLLHEVRLQNLECMAVPGPGPSPEVHEDEEDNEDDEDEGGGESFH